VEPENARGVSRHFQALCIRANGDDNVEAFYRIPSRQFAESTVARDPELHVTVINEPCPIFTFLNLINCQGEHNAMFVLTVKQELVHAAAF